MSSAAPPVNSSFAPPNPAELSRAIGPSADRTDGSPEQSFSFSDFLSVINPLQHIPVVGTIYRAITGDTIKPAQKVIGGLLFGGPVGLIGAAFNAIVEQATGKDVGQQALALVWPGSSEPAPDQARQYATADSESPAPSPSAEDHEVAPLSRALLGAEPAVDPATALAGDRHAGLLLGRTRNLTNRSRATGGGTSGRTLADYRAAEGRGLPVVDNQRAASGAKATAPIRLQTTAPLPERPQGPGAASEAMPTSPAAKENPASSEAPGEPFAAAMMRGLDRYREMKQSQNKTAPAVIDATL